MSKIRWDFSYFTLKIPSEPRKYFYSLDLHVHFIQFYIQENNIAHLLDVKNKIKIEYLE